MTVLSHALDRTVVIRAPRELVFGFFTDTARWAAWWGAGSTIEPHPGGRVYIRYPDGTEATGEVLEVAAPERIVFTYGYTKGTPIPPGASRVTIRLAAHEEGTRLHLTHAFADAAVCDEHLQGWRYQLSVFSNVVANELHARAADVIDRWFAAWALSNTADRRRALSAIASEAVTFRDRFSAVEGVSELDAHIGAAQRFMPGMRLQRAGAVRQCQGTVLADWTATSPDGQPRGSGTNVFELGPDGRVTRAVGFWN